MFGLAFDLGTTTLVGYLCDLSKGQIVKSQTIYNPQIEYGMDVLTRASYSAFSKENKDNMSQSLGKAIENLAEEMIVDNIDGLKSVVLVGNPVIMGSIASYSFSSGVLKAADIVRVPGIGDYVGADALAASLMIEVDRKKKTSFMIDVGTNTEIVLLSERVKYATSAAAGPALEGGNISCGMRGEDGAIDKISLTNGVKENSDIIFHVIDTKGEGIAPLGLCGSGLLSLIWQLRKVGVINSDGYLNSKTEALARKVPLRIAGRIVDEAEAEFEVDNGYKILKNARYFKLTDKVCLTQEDIRNVQLAVSAIRTGMDMLMMKAQITEADIDNIYFAGAFGNKISLESIVACGMVSMEMKEKIVQVGNIAGLGACAILMNENMHTEAKKIKESTKLVALAKEEAFQNMFIENMKFPEV